MLYAIGSHRVILRLQIDYKFIFSRCCIIDFTFTFPVLLILV
jgi:hypothetical protein